MSELSGLQELSLDPDASTSSWGMKYCLQAVDGRWLHLCKPELTSNPKLARMITARQALAIKRLHPEMRDLKLRKGMGRK